MNTLNYLSHMSSDHLSVEVKSDGYPFQLNQFDTTYDPLFSPLFDLDEFMPEINIAGVCESNDLVASMSYPMEPNEFDKYLGSEYSSNLTSDIDQNVLTVNSLPVYDIEKQKKEKSAKKQIFLSSSVGVGAPQRLLKPSHKIEIVYDLEEKYRPRYKSDYFAQNGIKRKPRYVTDRQGSHYVTLKVPLGIRGQIRVDWLTVPNANGRRYFMPYRFQANNESTDIADCNPIMVDIVHDNTDTIKLYLVLIKAKQDALRSLQPLKPYHPLKDAFGIIDKDAPEKTAILTPKKLIQKYQLGKSQLAFTLCVLSADCQSYIPEWDTTVYSSVLEEEAADSQTEKTIACPNCSTPITINDDGFMVQEVIPNKRKSSQVGNGKGKTIKKQKNVSQMVFCVN